jgi:hypothetical protein
MSMVPIMQSGQQLGLVGPDELHNFACELWKAAGYRVYNRFLKEPQKGPDGKSVLPPPQPPESVLVEQERQKGDAMKTQALTQEKMQMAQMEAQLKQQELAHAAQLKQQEQQGALALQQSNDQRQSALDQQKAQLDADFKVAELASKERIAQLQSATSIEVARINHDAQEGTSQMAEQRLSKANDPVLTKIAELAEQAGALAELVSAEKELIRDPVTGRASGVRIKPKAPSLQ